MGFGFGNSGQQRGQHQRLVLTQLGNQLQAGGQVLKDCFIQCRCFLLPHHNNIKITFFYLGNCFRFSDGTQATSSIILSSLSPTISDLLREVITIFIFDMNIIKPSLYFAIYDDYHHHMTIISKQFSKGGGGSCYSGSRTPTRGIASLFQVTRHHQHHHQLHHDHKHHHQLDLSHFILYKFALSKSKN